MTQEVNSAQIEFSPVDICNTVLGIKEEILLGANLNCTVSRTTDINQEVCNMDLSSILSVNESDVNNFGINRSIDKELCDINDLSPLTKKKKKKRKELFCEQCEYSTCYRNHLKFHVDAVHKGERPFACTQCQYKAGWKNDLKRHISSVHKGERLFHCPHCDYTSGWKYDLNRHISSSHRGEKSHPCPHCHFSTHRKDVLNRHVSSVHCGDKPHACPYCNFTASQKNNLKTHIAKIHKIVERSTASSNCQEVPKANTKIEVENVSTPLY